MQGVELIFCTQDSAGRLSGIWQHDNALKQEKLYFHTAFRDNSHSVLSNIYYKIMRLQYGVLGEMYLIRKEDIIIGYPASSSTSREICANLSLSSE